MTTASFDLILAASLIWLGSCTVGYHVAPCKNWFPQKINSPVAVAGLALLIALLGRLIFVALLPRGAEYEFDSFRRVAATLPKGDTVHDSPLVAGRHPNLPFQLYPIWVAGYVSIVSQLPFVFVVKLVPILFDGESVLLLVLAWYSWHFSKQNARRLGSLAPMLRWISFDQTRFSSPGRYLMARVHMAGAAPIA